VTSIEGAIDARNPMAPTSAAPRWQSLCRDDQIDNAQRREAAKRKASFAAPSRTALVGGVYRIWYTAQSV
jgi:hypothetical protein